MVVRGLTLGSLCLVAFAGCAASRPTTPMKAIRAQYDTLAIAFAAQDVPKIMSRRTEDFGAQLPDGTRQGPEQLAKVLKDFFVLNHPPIKSRNTIRALRMEGPDKAVATVFQQATRYQDLAGQRRRVDHDVTQQETWRRTPAGWRLAAVDSIRDKHRWVDGKPIDPSRPYDPAAPPFTPPKP